MAAKTPQKNPLSHLRPQSDYRLEWEAVDAEEAPAPVPTDLLGLTPDDRAALGLTPTAPAAARGEMDRDAARELSRILR